MVQWLRLCTPTTEATGSIPGQRIRIPQAIRCDQKNNNNNNKIQEKTSQVQMPSCLHINFMDLGSFFNSLTSFSHPKNNTQSTVKRYNWYNICKALRRVPAT